MKEVLIYGALVAAVIGASVPVIQGLTTSMTTAGQSMNTQIQNQLDGIIGSLGQGSGN
jgi:mannose/fructose/N-acetylgalactosamine-specific phosphotransferase system component IID